MGTLAARWMTISQVYCGAEEAMAVARRPSWRVYATGSYVTSSFQTLAGFFSVATCSALSSAPSYILIQSPEPPLLGESRPACHTQT